MGGVGAGCRLRRRSRATIYNPADIVKLIDTAILMPIEKAGKIVASYTLPSGTQVSLPLDTALKMRDYYRQLANQASGDELVSGFAEMGRTGSES